MPDEIRPALSPSVRAALGEDAPRTIVAETVDRLFAAALRGEMMHVAIEGRAVACNCTYFQPGDAYRHGFHLSGCPLARVRQTVDGTEPAG